MINIFDDTPEEKEQNIADMLQQGYTYKDIMRECHVSPSTISRVRKERFGSIEEELEKTTQISKESSALKLFSEGRTPLEVAIELDLATDYVLVIHQRYHRLRNLEWFNSSFEQVKGNIGPYMQLFNLMNDLKMTPEQVAEQVKYGIDLPQLQSMHSSLRNEVYGLEREKMGLVCQVQLMADQKEDHVAELQYYNYQCEMKKKELLQLGSDINSKIAVIQNLNNDGEYVRLKEDAKKETKSIMQNNYVLSAVTLSATLEAIRRYPDNQTLMFDIVSSQSYSAMPYQKHWMESHTPQLLQLIGNVQNEIAEQITSMVVSPMKSIP